MEKICETPKEFFRTQIDVVNSFTSEEYKLTNRERDFLVECCMFNHNGGDLDNFESLSEYFLNRKFFKRKQDISTYKYKISVKKWAKSTYEFFTLPKALDKEEGDSMSFNLELKYTYEVSD